MGHPGLQLQLRKQAMYEKVFGPSKHSEEISKAEIQLQIPFRWQNEREWQNICGKTLVHACE